jgi:hypothetical protein
VVKTADVRWGWVVFGVVLFVIGTILRALA